MLSLGGRCLNVGRLLIRSRNRFSAGALSLGGHEIGQRHGVGEALMR